MAYLEHVNVTVSDPVATAKRLEAWFDWKVRWSGEALNGGTTYHIGNDTSYIAAYTPRTKTAALNDISYAHHGALNHVAVVVDDLDETERRVKATGIETHNHQDYEPGRRFYFDDPDGIEFEVVSY